MGALKNIALAAGLLAAAGMGETVYFYNRTMKRGNAKTERTTRMSGTDWEKYFPLMEERRLCAGTAPQGCLHHFL